MARVPQRTSNGMKSTPPDPSARPDTPRTVMDGVHKATPSRGRNPPHLPTPLERIALAVFPFLLIFGTVFSILSPHTRSAPYDPVTQSHSQDPSLAPSYFARKNNLFNVFFVKRGWAWTTFALILALRPMGGRLRAGLRWAAMTAYWYFVTQWFFGPPIIDRSFRWTGGKCEPLATAEAHGESIGEVVVEALTSVACKATGGKWKGGHDISGHVFLLVLGTTFLMHEVGWPVLRWIRGGQAEERCVVMPDGAVKSANVEARGEARGAGVVGLGEKTALAIMAMNLWMLLMTAIYFHTWFEKLTGLLTAFIGVYVVYYVPRFVPGLRHVIGLPGI